MITQSSEIIQLGPLKAEWMLAKNIFIGQRPITQSVVDDYCDEMMSEMFYHTQIVIAIGPDGAVSLLDGQHRCSAIVKTGKTVSVTVTTLKCFTDEDVLEIWKKYDGGKARTLTEMGHCETKVAGVDWRKGISAQVISAATYIEKMTGKKKSDRAALIRKYVDEGNFINDIFYKKGYQDSKPMRKKMVVVCMIDTFRIAPEEAMAFWLAVRTGELLVADDPRYRLREYLGGLDDNKHRRVVDKDVLIKCLKAWNFFRKNKSIKRLRVLKGESIPKAV